MSDRDFDYIRLCRISTPFGTRGWSRATILEFYPHSYPSPVYLSRSKILKLSPESLTCSLQSCQNRSGFSLLKLSGCSTPEQASFFVGFYLFISRDAVPALAVSEYYDQDLLGLSVFDACDTFCGTVSDLIMQPAHAILLVTHPDNGSVMVPFVDSWVSAVDLQQSRLIIPDFDLLR